MVTQAATNEIGYPRDTKSSEAPKEEKHSARLPKRKTSFSYHGEGPETVQDHFKKLDGVPFKAAFEQRCNFTFKAKYIDLLTTRSNSSLSLLPLYHFPRILFFLRAQVWDVEKKQYRPWGVVQPERTVPTQFLAFEQLRFRWHSGEPIAVAVVAPAGFGKSELIAALMYFCVTVAATCQTIAVTGVAAANCGGCTLHSFALLRSDGTTSIANNAQVREKLRETQVLIIDEAMMSEDALIFILAEICREYPLKSSRHRVASHRSLTFFGGRDVVMCGDIRQLAPASGKRPFWSTPTFRNLFEIFRLQEDRRHERNLAMQAIKEKVAWGGIRTCPDTDAAEWPVDEAVHA